MLVAVYGSLRKGLSNYNYYLKTSKYVGSFESEPIYTLKSLEAFPALLKEGETSVVMEIFRINQDTLDALDKLEGTYGIDDKNNFYNREMIETPYGEAFVYFYNSAEDIKDARIVRSGDWKEYLANHRLYANV